MMETKRVEWIDGLRGLCMLAILWYHTDFYYTSDVVIPYELYVTNVLAAFFFISGYLFPQRERLDVREKLRKIVTTLLIPYFFFTAIIAIPKSLVNGSGEILQPFIGILLGKASWFVTTLIVCEVIFTFLVKAGKAWVCIVLLAIGVFMKRYDYYDYWNVVRALQNVIFLYAGYMCKRKGVHFGDNKWIWAPLSLLVAVLLKYVYFVSPVGDTADKASLLRACCYYADMMAGIVFLLSVASLFAYSRFMRYVGRNSLYYYFFCGACPTIAAIITKSFIAPYDGFYPMVMVPFVIAVVLDTGVAVLINKVKMSYSARL